MLPTDNHPMVDEQTTEPGQPEHGDKGARCRYCDGYMTWCSVCQQWSRTCCVEYGTCECS